MRPNDVVNEENLILHPMRTLLIWVVTITIPAKILGPGDLNGQCFQADLITYLTTCYAALDYVKR